MDPTPRSVPDRMSWILAIAQVGDRDASNAAAAALDACRSVDETTADAILVACLGVCGDVAAAADADEFAADDRRRGAAADAAVLLARTTTRPAPTDAALDALAAANAWRRAVDVAARARGDSRASCVTAPKSRRVLADFRGVRPRVGAAASLRSASAPPPPRSVEGRSARRRDPPTDHRRRPLSG